MLHLVSSPQDAVRLIKTLISIPQDLPEEASDVIYQANVPITLDVNITGRELKINRLLKWGTGVYQILNMGGGLGDPTQMLSSAIMQAVRFEMDVNTTAEVSILLSQHQIIEVIKALATHARAISKVGGFPR
jgi:hypothetical protein